MTDLDREFNAMCDKAGRNTVLWRDETGESSKWSRPERFQAQWLERNADKPISERGLTPDPDPLQDPQR